MKRTLVAAVAMAAAFAVLPTTSMAAPTVLGADAPTAGGFSSDNVEWVANVPFSSPSGSGGRLVGRYFYAVDSTKLTIYDTKDPLNPTPVGFLENPHEPIFTREDIDTNGKILLLPNMAYAPGPLHIVDVEDKTNPTIIASVPNSSEHTFSCILDCTYAYGSEGKIVDLRNPSKPKIVGNWTEGMPAGGGHDVTEVAPGLVLTASTPIMYLDARKNPAKPKVIALGPVLDGRYMHTAVWPNAGKDDFLLMASETNFKPRCNDAQGSFMTWDASQWNKSKTFSMIDEYKVTNGTYQDGNAGVNAVGCSAHWVEERPGFENGGMVAAAYFEHGTRLLDIDSKGKIKEAGWFVPHAGSTGAVYWRTKDIIYATDYTRGIDILRIKG